MLIILTILLLFVYFYLGRKQPAIALVTSPFVAGTMIFIGVVDENAAVTAIAPGIFIITIISVLSSKPEADLERWPQKCAKWILIIFVFLLLLVTFGVAFGPLGISGIVFLALLIGSMIAYSLTSRHATDAYVISTIGSSMRQNLPLPMALESAASGCSDKRSRILIGIKKWLVQGYSLSDSIRRGYPTCPGYALAMIAAAERIGQLPRAIHAIEVDMLVVAETAEQAERVALENCEQELANGGHYQQTAAAPVAKCPAHLRNVIPWGPSDDDPRRDWTCKQWLDARKDN